MRIKLDENLPAELADDLVRLGHLVDTVVGEGLEGRAYPLVADAARRARRCLGRSAVRRGVLELLPEIERRQPLTRLLLVAGDSGIRVRK